MKFSILINSRNERSVENCATMGFEPQTSYVVDGCLFYCGTTIVNVDLINSISLRMFTGQYSVELVIILDKKNGREL